MAELPNTHNAKTEVKELTLELEALKRKVVILESKLHHKHDTTDIDAILDEIEENERKYNQTIENETLNEFEENREKEKTSQFWEQVDTKLSDRDIDFIKDLVRNKELNMDETDGKGRTLLMLSALHGCYELVSMCINLGANIDKLDEEKKTALKLSQQNGFPDIEELLIMNQLKTELGQRIEDTTNDIARRQGITENFNRIVNDLTQQSEDAPPRCGLLSNQYLRDIAVAFKRELFEMLLRVLIRSIEEKTAYSDDMLYIAFYYEVHINKKLPTDTVLYAAIKKAVIGILSDTTNKKNWFWLKQYLLKSSIWYFRMDPKDEKSQFIHYCLFEWLQHETTKQSKILSQPMRAMEDAHASEWNRLIQFDIETPFDGLSVRQDAIDGGFKSEYTKEHLTQTVSLSATFNPLLHYDLSQYLTKLVLICHEANDAFQSEVQRIFAIDKETKRNKTLKVAYQRGPVKRLQRCYAKCQSDYRDEAFPTSAHVLDIIRCSLVFSDVPAMLDGMRLFEQKIKENDHGCTIVQVVRVKNGFAAYTHDTASYTDIKFNVIVRGAEYNVIGEMQFLIAEMLNFKKIGHSLYSIERTKEFVDDLSAVLPVKLNFNKQLFIHSARNNLNGVTDLMVTHAFNTKLLLQMNQKNQSIFTSICSANGVKLFKYLIKIILPMKLKERLVFPDQSGTYPLLRAIKNNHYNGVLKCVFNHEFLQKALINDCDASGKTPLQQCWFQRKLKCALLILNTVQSEKEILKMITTRIPCKHDWNMNSDMTCLQSALYLGDMECIQFLFDQTKRDQNTMQQLLGDKESSANFHYACRSGKIDCLRLLIPECNEEQRAKLFVNVFWPCRCSPLFNAVNAGSPECTEFILSQMSDDQKQTFFGETGYNFTIKQYVTPIHSSTLYTSKRHIETLKVMIAHLSNDHADLGSAFLYAARNDDVELGKLILTKASNHEAVLNIVNISRDKLHCVLHACAKYNSLNFLKYLFEMISGENAQFVAKQNNSRDINGDDNEWYGYSALMIAAAKCHTECCKLILDKLKNDTELLNKVLKLKKHNAATALELAAISMYKNNANCARTIIGYYAKDDIESIFIPCVELGDLRLIQSIWNKAGNDSEMQNKLLSVTDKDKNNCFLLAAKNGNAACLKWLLSINPKENERLVMQKHITTGLTPLLLVVSNDASKEKDKVDATTTKNELTEGARQSYFECVELMFDTVKSKKELLFAVDNNKKNALMYSCGNANAHTATYLLSQMNEKEKTLIIGHEDTNKFNCFHHSVRGGNIDVARMIYENAKPSMEDDKALLLSLQNGHIDITEWILFDILQSSKQKVRFLNQTIQSSKSGRQFETALKQWITRIVANEVKRLDDVDDITKIFPWLLTHDPIDIACIKLILSKLPQDNYSKSIFAKETKCVSHASTHNQMDVLQELLGYFQSFSDALFYCASNVLMDAITSRSDKCAIVVLEFIQSERVKNALICAVDSKNENALMKAMDLKSDGMIQLVLSHHSRAESLLYGLFIHALKTSNFEAASVLLNQANNKSAVLNCTEGSNDNALMYALRQKTDESLKFIMDELDKESDEKEAMHPMYMARNDHKENIFHVMFRTQCNMERIKLIEHQLDKATIFDLLSDYDLSENTPLHNAFRKNGIEILEWILDHAEDAHTKLKWITSRNKFNHSLLYMKSYDKPAASFICKVITDCLQQMDIKTLPIDTLQEIFKCTDEWKYPDLQKTILESIEPNQVRALLSRDNMLQTDGRTILHTIVNVNNLQICKAILPAITDIHMFYCHGGEDDRTFLEHAIANRKYDCIKYILDYLQSQAKTISIGEYIGEEHVSGLTALTRAYKNKNAEITQLLLSYLKEEELHFAVQAAAKYDRNATIIPESLSKVSSTELKYDLLHGCDSKGNTLLKTGMENQKFVSWFVNTIEGDDPILFKPNDTRRDNAWIDCDSSRSNIMEAVFNKLDPKSRLQHVLMMNFNRESLLTDRYKRDVVIKIIISALTELSGDIDDIDTAFPLFECAVSSLNIECAKLIISKTAPSIRNELWLDHGRKWNVFAGIISKGKDFKPMLQILTNEMQNSDIIKIIQNDNDLQFKEQSMFHQCCKKRDMECMNMLLSVYDECKESYDEEWMKSNWNHVNALHLAIELDNSDLAAFILKRIENDTDRLQMIMQQTKPGANAFDVATSVKTKEVLNACMASILENIQTNTIHSDSFMFYFQWLIKENELDSIRKLFDTFNHNDFILKALLYPHPNTKQNSAHIACTHGRFEILEYLLSFIRTNASHQKRLLLSIDTQERTPLMISCERGFIKCTSALLDALQSKPKLLSELYSMTNDVSTFCAKECIELVMSHCDTCDLEMLQKLFIYSIDHSKREIIDIVFSTAKQLKIKTTKLFDYVNEKGVNALYVCVQRGNTKWIKIMLKSVDTKTKKWIQFVSGFTTYSGRNLMHAACESGNIEGAQLILSWITYPSDKHALLLANDHANNNPLQIYLSKHHSTRFVAWYLSNLDTKNKLSLICNQNVDSETALHHIKKAKLFEKIVTDCHQDHIAAIGSICEWSMIVRIILTMRWDGIQVPLHIIKSILNNYPTDAEKMKLLTIRDSYTSKNVFDCLSGATPLSVFTYLLSFIKQKDDYKLLIHPAEDGNTLLHRVMGEYQSHSRGSLTLGKLKHIMSDDSISNALLSLQVIGSGFTLSKNEMILFHTLNTTDRISLIMDEFSQGIFGYVHDHENEFMPKLLHLRHKDTHDTLLMRFFRSVNASKNLFMFAWIVSWIKKLDPSEIVSFVTATNLIGDTAFHLLQCVGTKMKKETNKQKDNRNTKYAKDLLMLLPTQAIKEKAILQPNHRGMTAFMSVLRGEYSTGSAYIMWNNIQNMETKLRLMNRNCQLEENAMNDNWKDWCKQALRLQRNPLHFDDVELLVPFFYYALKRGDSSFARAIVNKINTNSHRTIIAFLSTKLPLMKDECALHFASYCRNIETLQLVFQMMNELTNEEITALLLDGDIMRNKDDKTPFIVACEQNNFVVIEYLLSRIDNESDKLRMMQVEADNKNAIWIACSKWENVQCLKVILSSISSKVGIESIIKYKNSKNENIYHYVNTIEIKECIKSWNAEALFGFNEFHQADDDGATPFLNILKRDSTTHCRNTLIEWILNAQCQSDEERAQLIFSCDHNGQHSLDLASDASTIWLLQNTITNIISSASYKNQTQTVFALFLWSLRKAKLVLTKWLLAQLSEPKQKKVMNQSNEFGMNAVLCSCKAAQIASLHFLLSHPFFDQQLIYSSDHKDKNAIYYSCCTNTPESVACLRTVLAFYKTKITTYSDLLIRNRVFDHAMRYYRGTYLSNTQKWSVQCILDEWSQSHAANINLMHLLFKENEKGEVALIEHGTNRFIKEVAYWIKSYFEDIDEISDLDCKYAGYALLYLRANCWHIHQLIAAKCRDEAQLSKVLNVRNGEGYSVLDYVCMSEQWCIVEWYLSQVIPNNHPILMDCNTFTNQTGLMYLLASGAIQFAEQLLSKIDDKKERLNLIEKKDYKNQSILDSAVCKDIPSQVEWIRHQIEN
eukprot:334531_1